MDGTAHDSLAEELRRAIAARDALRPGTAAHWRASCEARALMKRLGAEKRFTSAARKRVAISERAAPQPPH